MHDEAPVGRSDEHANGPASNGHDDLDGYETTMSRLARRSRGWLALLLAAALVVPGTRWLFDELAFQRSGDAVEEQLGDDAALVEAVLLVRSIDCTGRTSTGSGFVTGVGPDTVVLTNRHVVDGARTVSLRRLTGGPSVPVAEHALSPSADVAVLRAGEDTELPAPLVLGDDPRVGEQVRLVGFPAAMPYTTAGTVAEVSPRRALLELQTDPGASGSPVVDGDDRVVAQIFARTGDGLGVATTASALREAVEEAEPAPGC